MTDPKKESLVRLEAISAALGVPIDRFLEGSLPDSLVGTSECLRLWYSLKTDQGREQALDAMRQAVKNEAN
ncbi:hypothetical protein [Methylobacterium sp. J-068]|uniref:hypothetical protein n=1 Tax=Methylobacterium sp. J-068 TaxID=2836649 RepID=UPI001FB9D901|nr:hypothetical protein [Methylobacterium sp. J-068]MCJ2033262.1 hypothetical protein [Methylobacterium sp. J-068]